MISGTGKRTDGVAARGISIVNSSTKNGSDVARQRRTSLRRVVKESVFLLLVIAFCCLALALIPRRSVIGRPGDGKGVVRVARQVETGWGLRPGGIPSLQLTEGDINAYLAERKTDAMDIESLSIECRQDVLRVRLVRKHRIPLGFMSVNPVLSMDLVLTEQGGTLKPANGAIGWLPLLGPTANLPASIIRDLVTEEHEWELIEKAGCIESAIGHVSVFLP